MTPERSIEQRMSALATANERRANGARVREEVAAGTLTLADALLDPRSQHVPVYRLLMAVRGRGPQAADRVLVAHRISGARRVGQLTSRQITALSRDGRTMPARSPA